MADSAEVDEPEDDAPSAEGVGEAVERPDEPDPPGSCRPEVEAEKEEWCRLDEKDRWTGLRLALKR